MTQARKLVKAQMPGNDSTLADAFAYRNRDMYLWVHALKKWRIWDGRTWVDSPEGSQIREAIQDYVQGCRAESDAEHRARNKYLSNNSIRHVESRLKDKLHCPIERFDSNGRLLTVANGTLDVLTGDLYEFSPDDFITKFTPLEYDPKIPKGNWARFVRQLFGTRDRVRAVQAIMGYSIFTDGNPEQLFVVLKGETGSGKSIFLETFKTAFPALVNAASTSLFRDKQAESARPDVVSAMFSRLVYAEEMSAAIVLHSDQIKRFTGNTTVMARQLHKEPIERIPACVPFVATNHMPEVTGPDKAYRRRLLVVNVVPSAKQRNRATRDIKDLHKKLAIHCGPEILKWLVDGYLLYQEYGLDWIKELFEEETDDAYTETSVYLTFLKECTEIDPSGRESNADIKARFDRYCLENGHTDPSSSIQLGRSLNALDWAPCKLDGGNVRGRRGRRLVG